jgi:hypothetical protein
MVPQVVRGAETVSSRTPLTLFLGGGSIEFVFTEGENCHC